MDTAIYILHFLRQDCFGVDFQEESIVWRKDLNFLSKILM